MFIAVKVRQQATLGAHSRTTRMTSAQWRASDGLSVGAKGEFNNAVNLTDKGEREPTRLFVRAYGKHKNAKTVTVPQGVCSERRLNNNKRSQIESAESGLKFELVYSRQNN